MILVVDNFDSFVFNLARMLEELGQETEVVRNDAVDVDAVRRRGPGAIVISPGPCDPPAAGVSLDLVRELGSEVPILGVCLGHQVIAAAYGASVVRGEPVHGRADPVYHAASGVFEGLPSPIRAARYHSLVVSRRGLPPVLEVLATCGDGTIMGLRHRDHPVVGLQFHPESVLTEHGYRILRNFLRWTRS